MLACFVVFSFAPSHELLVAESFLVLAFLFLAIFFVVSYFLGFATSRSARMNRHLWMHQHLHHTERCAHK